MSDDAGTRAQYDELLRALSARASTTHFAHAAVVGFVGAIVSGGAGKLFWDFGEAEYLPWTLAAASLGLCGLAYAVVRFVLGRRALVVELEKWSRMQALRRELKLDEPHLQLPGHPHAAP